MSAALPSESPCCARKSALVVGGDFQIAATVYRALPEWRVQSVLDNGAAFKLLQTTACDLVVTEENTPAKTDIELLRKIRLIHPHTRLIILTNVSTPADVIAAMREHAFSYFSTPLSMDAFSAIVQLAAEGPTWDDGIEVLSATPNWIRLAARCDKKTADRLLQFLHEAADLPDPEKEDVAAACREMLLNAIEYGGRFDPAQYVELSYLRARHLVICRVKDPGEGFSLDEISHSAAANPPDDPLRHQTHRDALGLRPGGFGVLLAKNLVDELIYSEKGNDVLLIRYLDSRGPAGEMRGSV